MIKSLEKISGTSEMSSEQAEKLGSSTSKVIQNSVDQGYTVSQNTVKSGLSNMGKSVETRANSNNGKSRRRLLQQDSNTGTCG